LEPKKILGVKIPREKSLFLRYKLKKKKLMTKWESDTSFSDLTAQYGMAKEAIKAVMRRKGYKPLLVNDHR
jgi:hypothetical protein